MGPAESVVVVPSEVSHEAISTVGMNLRAFLVFSSTVESSNTNPQRNEGIEKHRLSMQVVLYEVVSHISLLLSPWHYSASSRWEPMLDRHKHRKLASVISLRRRKMWAKKATAQAVTMESPSMQ